jgi:hypothetical protein
MYSKIFNWTKTFVGRIITVLAGIVVVMTFMDFLLKWQIYSYLFDITTSFLALFYKFPFEFFFLSCLVLLSFFIWRLNKQLINSRPGALEKKIIDTKNSLEVQMKKNLDLNTSQIKKVEDNTKEQLLDIRRIIVDFEIENHRNKNQVGEVSKLIEKLGMDIERGWGTEDTLLEIKEYIKQKGLPTYFLNDLDRTLKDVPGNLNKLRDEILNLAQEKLYNPYK